MKIATYILNSSITTANLPSMYDLKNNIDTLKGSFFSHFKDSLLEVIKNENDVICFICKSDGFIDLEANLLEEAVVDLVQENVMSFYLKASSKSQITFSTCYQIISQIEDVSAFVLTKPIFQYALSLLNNDWNEKDETNVLKLLGLLIPHSILVNFTVNYFVDKNVSFHIISAYRNAGKYIEECWKSVDRQTHQNYKLYFIDDFSDDFGLNRIPHKEKIVKSRNDKRLYALQNIVNVLINNTFNQSDVICLLDGDDKLTHKYVLSILNEVYQDENIEFTYGSMNYFNSYGKIFGSPYTKKEFANIRKSPWRVAPFRTFKYKLFERLLNVDPVLTSLKDSDYQFIRMPADMTLSFPLLELTCYNKVKFIPTPLYQYRLHKNNDMYVNRKEQYEGEIKVRSKMPIKAR